jgi:hypothetical protein
VEVDQMDELQHSLAVVGAATAVVASFRQGRTAKKKSARHRQLSQHEKEGTLKTVLKSDAEHFKRVGFWWYAFVVGAFLAVVAELIDWFS